MAAAACRGRGRRGLTMQTRLRICRRKRRFASAADAILAAQQAEVTLRPYRCDRCRWFHLTGRTKGKWMSPG